MKRSFLILMLLLLFPVFMAYSQSEDPSSKKIIGTWFTDANRDVKWMFTQDGKLYNYNKDRYQVMYKYTISHSCQNYSDDTIEYITLMDKDGDEFCFRINSINDNKNGVLSLTNMTNMQPLLFVNNVSLTIRK